MFSSETWVNCNPQDAAVFFGANLEVNEFSEANHRPFCFGDQHLSLFTEAVASEIAVDYWKRAVYNLLNLAYVVLRHLSYRYSFAQKSGSYLG